MAVDFGFGEKKITEFYQLEYYGAPAVRLHPDLSKGIPVRYEGTLNIQKWTGRDGTEKSKWIIKCWYLDRATWPDKAEYLDDAPKPASHTPAPDDDIPF